MVPDGQLLPMLLNDAGLDGVLLIVTSATLFTALTKSVTEADVSRAAAIVLLPSALVIDEFDSCRPTTLSSCVPETDAWIAVS